MNLSIKNFIKSLSICLFFSCTSENEKQKLDENMGFQDIKLGTAISDYAKSSHTFEWNVISRNEFYEKNPNVQIGDIKVSNIELLTKNSIIKEISVNIPYGNDKTIIEALNKKYGQPDSTLTRSTFWYGERMINIWNGKKVCLTYINSKLLKYTDDSIKKEDGIIKYQLIKNELIKDNEL